jgi:predicted metal-dependent phosphoesterase TrpH
MLTGALHVHSTYSDGEFTLPELRQVYKSAGCQFVCITDHAEYFDASMLEAYLDECAHLSDDSFCFVPGLEFTCDRRMHILGFGAPVLQSSTAPEEMIRQIRAARGIAVIAHPMDSAFEWIESFSELPDGIETWNSKYDGQHAPRPQTFQLLNRLQRRAPRMGAFYGQDLHWKHQNRGLLNHVQAKTSASEGILDALRDGAYGATKAELELPSNGLVATATLVRFAASNRRDAGKRRLMKRAKRWADSAGVRIPSALKAQLRRIF